MLKWKIFLNHYEITVYKILIKFHARYKVLLFRYSFIYFKAEVPCALFNRHEDLVTGT